VLAGLIHVILAEGLHDNAFVAEHTSGLDGLRRAVAGYTPEAVAARAGIDASDLVAAARIFGTAQRGYAGAGTGANMSGFATLVEYLVLCLDTLCGHYLREGERVRAAPALQRRREYKAQAISPRPTNDPGPPLRVPGRAHAPGALQLTDLVDEMLLDGDGRVRALLCVGGNPATAWPDQVRTIEALQSLDLLVVVDPFLTATAKLAHYVVAPKLTLETPAATNLQDFYPEVACTGYVDSYAHYVEPAVEPPEGSELVEEWELLMRLADAMGHRMHLGRIELDPAAGLTTGDVLAGMLRNARVPLDEIKAKPHGARFVDEAITVGPPNPETAGRLDIGSEPMLRDLETFLDAPRLDDADRPFRLISRRMLHVENSMLRDVSPHRARHNPAFLHPDDLTELGLTEGDVIELNSRRGTITGIVASDASLRRGVVSMAHGYGDLPETDDLDPTLGANTARLVDVDADHDPYSGQPRMSDLPVRVRGRETANH
jgi:anaerobic selenocysteine-containing dehydrogenase